MARKVSTGKSAPRFMLPKRQVVLHISDIACMHHYYIPLIGKLFQRRVEILCELIGPRRYSTLLDIGFGGGILFPTLGSISHTVLGVDLHRRHQEVREFYWEHYRIRPLLVRGALPHLPFSDDSVDGIISLSNLYYLGDQLEHSLNEINRVASADADIYIGTASCTFYRLVLQRTAYRKFPPIRRNVFKSVRKHFVVEEMKTIPALIPVNFSFFFCCRCKPRKK